MGRRPNQLILTYFERGSKLEDASNRYQYTCRACGTHFPKGRMDSLIAHLTGNVRRCEDVSADKAVEIKAALDDKSAEKAQRRDTNIHNHNHNHDHNHAAGSSHVDDNTNNARAASGSPEDPIDVDVDGNPTRTTLRGRGSASSAAAPSARQVKLPVGSGRKLTGLEALAEASRQVERPVRGPGGAVAAANDDVNADADALGVPDESVIDPMLKADGQGDLAMAAHLKRAIGQHPFASAKDLSSIAATANLHINTAPVARLMGTTTTTTMAAGPTSSAAGATPTQPDSAHGIVSTPATATSMATTATMGDDFSPLFDGNSGGGSTLNTPKMDAIRIAATWPRRGAVTPGGTGGGLGDSSPIDTMVRAATYPRAIAANPSGGAGAATTTVSAGSVRPGGSVGPNGTEPPQKVQRVRGKFSDSRRKEVQEIRKKGACLRCKMLRKTCSGDDPCSSCARIASARLWKTPCKRIRLVQAFDLFTQGIFEHSAARRTADVYMDYLRTDRALSISLRNSKHPGVSIKFPGFIGQRIHEPFPQGPAMTMAGTTANGPPAYPGHAALGGSLSASDINEQMLIDSPIHSETTERPRTGEQQIHVEHKERLQAVFLNEDIKPSTTKDIETYIRDISHLSQEEDANSNLDSFSPSHRAIFHAIRTAGQIVIEGDENLLERAIQLWHLTEILTSKSLPFTLHYLPTKDTFGDTDSAALHFGHPDPAMPNAWPLTYSSSSMTDATAATAVAAASGTLDRDTSSNINNNGPSISDFMAMLDSQDPATNHGGNSNNNNNNNTLHSNGDGGGGGGGGGGSGTAEISDAIRALELNLEKELDEGPLNMLSFQLLSRFELLASSWCGKLLNELEKRLLRGKAHGFDMFLVAVLLFACVERMEWFVRRFEEESKKPDWPLAESPGSLAKNARDFAVLVCDLLKQRHVAPRVVSDPDTGFLTCVHKDDVAKEWFEGVKVTEAELQERRDAAFDAEDPGSMEMKYCALLLLSSERDRSLSLPTARGGEDEAMD